MRSSVGRVIVAVLVAAFASTAMRVQAETVTLYFNGTILPGSLTYERGVSGNWDGRRFSGSMTFDPATQISGGDGSTYQLNSSTASWMSLTLCLPDRVVISSDTPPMDSYQYLTEIYRNYTNPAGSNVLLFNVNNHDYNSANLLHRYLHFDWEVVDYLGNSTTLFVDPDGGLSYSQPFDLTGYSSPITAAGHAQAGSFNLVEMDKKSALIYNYVAGFTLSFIGVSPSPDEIAASVGHGPRCTAR